MAFSNAMTDDSSMYIPQPGTSSPFPHGYGNRPTPYLPQPSPADPIYVYRAPGGYHVYHPHPPPMKPPMHAPMHVPTNGRYIRIPFTLSCEHSLALPTDLTQDANLPPLQAIAEPANDNANINPPAAGPRKRGRPLGRKNNPKDMRKPSPKPRGRPKGSKDTKPRAPYRSVKAAREARMTVDAPVEPPSPTSHDDTASTGHSNHSDNSLAPGLLTPASPPPDGFWQQGPGYALPAGMTGLTVAGGSRTELTAAEEGPVPAPDYFGAYAPFQEWYGAPTDNTNEAETAEAGATVQHGIDIDNIDPVLAANTDWAAIEEHFSNDNFAIDTPTDEAAATGHHEPAFTNDNDEAAGSEVPEFDIDGIAEMDGNDFLASFL